MSSPTAIFATRFWQTVPTKPEYHADTLRCQRLWKVIKMPKKTNVILTSYPWDGWTPTKLKIGSWTDTQKNDFLNYIKLRRPLVDGHYYNTCSFNVHVDDYIIHSRGFDTSKIFKPIKSKNKKNEVIIEIITDDEHRECWPACPATCSLCMQDGQCTSPFIQKFVGEVLFPEKYAKQK